MVEGSAMHRKSLLLAVPSGREHCSFVNTGGEDGHGWSMSYGCLWFSSIKNVLFALIISFVCYLWSLGRKSWSSFQLKMNSLHLGRNASWNIVPILHPWDVAETVWNYILIKLRVRNQSPITSFLVRVLVLFPLYRRCPLYSGSCGSQDSNMHETVDDARKHGSCEI